jgi:hypothetical protein
MVNDPQLAQEYAANWQEHQSHSTPRHPGRASVPASRDTARSRTQTATIPFRPRIAPSLRLSALRL